MIRPFVLAVVFLAVALALPGVAQAKPKVAFTAIVGDDGNEVGEAIAATLDEWKLAPAKDVKKKIKTLGLEDDWADKDFAKLGKELEVDAVVRGTLDTKGGKKNLTFQIYIHGKKVKGFNVQFSNPKSDKFQKAVHDKLVEKVGDASGGGDADDEPKKKKKVDDDDDKPKKKHKKADDDDDEPKKKHKKDDDDGPESEDGTPKLAAHMANHVAIRIDAGISFATRKLSFVSRQFTEGKGPPKPYSNSTVPGARVEGELYPLAFQNPNSPAAGLGLGFDFDQTISLTLKTTAQPDAALKATQRHYAIGVRYRIAFGQTASSPTVTLAFNYGNRIFKVDRSPLMAGNELDLPDVAYKMYEPGAALRVPVAPAIALVAMARAMLISDAGSIVTGTQYGQAKVFGFEGQAGLDIVLGDRFAIRLVGEIAQVGYTFTGVGELAKNRDNNPATPDVGGATDRSIGGSATLAVLY